MKRIAIMQPTYLPWIGYFDLIDRTDIFVLLDSVQFNKRSWQQRNRIKSFNGEQLLTIPVFTKGKFNQMISEVEIDRSNKFEKKHYNSIEINYKKSSYFLEYKDEFKKLLFSKEKYLANFNISLIKWIIDKLKIETEMYLSSDLDVNGEKSELLCNICSKFEVDTYISPLGSMNYIENDNHFEKRKIKLVYQNYSHPTYKQRHGGFISHLSVIDLLFNEGHSSLSIIRS